MTKRRRYISEMKYHYTYRITNIKEGMYYYGVHSCDCLPKEDIGVRYFSSAKKEFIKHQKENPQDYKYKVLKIFSTRKEADKHESFLHKKFNVRMHTKFYNKNNAGEIYRPTSESAVEFWKNASDEFRELHSANTAKGVSESWKRMSENDYINRCDNISKSLFGKKEPEWKKLNQSIKMTGAGNSNDKDISIYDANGSLKFNCVGNFKKICELNNLPHCALSKSHKSGGEPIYSSKSSYGHSIKYGWSSYKWWYAIQNTH